MRGIAGFIAVAYFFTALGAAPLDGDESSRIPRDPAARQARDCGTAQCCGCAPYLVRCSIASPCGGDATSTVQRTAIAGHCCSSSAEGAIVRASPQPSPSPKLALTTTAPSATTSALDRSGETSSGGSEASTKGQESPPASSGTCLHMPLLHRAGVYAHHLVHAGDVWAAMLCLEEDTAACATPHHRVYVAGKVVSMKVACESLVRCFVRYGYVNNVMSHLDLYPDIATGQVVFSHFDHRYPEWTQRILHRSLAFWRQRHIS